MFESLRRKKYTEEEAMRMLFEDPNAVTVLKELDYGGSFTEEYLREIVPEPDKIGETMKLLTELGLVNGERY